LKDGYFKVLQLTVFLSIPAAGAIFVLAPPFTAVFLGQKWLPMVSALQVLCFFGVIRSIGATMGPILYGTGRPQVQTKVSTIQLVFLAIIIYPLTISLQILGTSLAVLVSNLLGFILITRETKTILNFRYGEVCTVLAVPLCSYLLVFILLFLPITFMSPQSNIISILLILLLTTIIYFVIMYLWDRKRYRILESIHNLSNTSGLQ
jgi:O-antigen/teichoic acid export membrane protein